MTQELTAPQQNIAQLRTVMQSAIDDGQVEQIDPPVDHLFAKGLYGRRIYVPAGTTVVTKVHMTQHITIALKGCCVMVDELGGHLKVEAPGMWVTEAGTQRAIHCIDDTEWVTVHATDITDDIPEVEAEIFSDTYTEFLERTKALPESVDVKLRLTT